MTSATLLAPYQTGIDGHFIGCTSTSIPNNALFLAVCLERWNEARRLVTGPSSYFLVNYRDDVLYNSCLNNAPLDIVKHIYQLAPHQIYYKDKYGGTCLYYACYEASEEIISFLIEVAPQYVCAEKYHNGYMPLSVAITQRRSPSIIEKMIDACSNHVVDSIIKETALKAFVHKWDYDVKQLVKKGVKLPRGHELDGYLEGSALVQQTMLIILQKFFLQNDREISNVDRLEGDDQACIALNPLHAAIEGDEISANFEIFLARTMPEELMKVDKKGNLPLHICAMKYANTSGVYENQMCQIFKLYPRAALIRNKEGKLPLTIAIENGMDWDEGVKQIVSAFPSMATEVLDGFHDQHPFMLSSSTSKSPINVAYQFLRMDPTIVQLGISYRK